MGGKWTPFFSYIAGAPLGVNHALFAVAEDTAEAKAVKFSQFLEWKEGIWSDGGTADWSTVSIDSVVMDGTVVIAGPSGEVRYAGGGAHRDENIFSKHSKRAPGPLREVRQVGQRSFAAGMGRQVYRRDGLGLWTDIGSPIMPPAGVVKGFESIDGFDPSEIYAVGWDGEIWHFGNNRWSAVETPTNLILTRVVCGGDGNVYACGQVGTLIRGRKAKWELIQHGATENDFWGLAWFGGSLYVATSKALYRLEGNALTRVPIGPDIPGSYYHLKSAYGELWSIGPKDVMLFDGKNWTRID